MKWIDRVSIACFLAWGQVSAGQGIPIGEFCTVSQILSQHVTSVTKIQTFGYSQPLFPEYFAVLGNDGKQVIVGAIARDNGGAHWVWWKSESELGEEFEVSSADNFSIARMQDGTEAIIYKGCARHLCGSDGVAGVMAFVPRANYFCIGRTIHGKGSFDPTCANNTEYKAHIAKILGSLR